MGVCLEVDPKKNAKAMQPLLQWARSGVRAGGSAAPDGVEVRARFLAWTEMGSLLAYAPEDPKEQAVVAMHNVLRHLYNNTPSPTPITCGCRLLRGTTARPPINPTTSYIWGRM